MLIIVKVALLVIILIFSLASGIDASLGSYHRDTGNRSPNKGPFDGNQHGKIQAARVNEEVKKKRKEEKDKATGTSNLVEDFELAHCKEAADNFRPDDRLVLSSHRILSPTKPPNIYNAIQDGGRSYHYFNPSAVTAAVTRGNLVVAFRIPKTGDSMAKTRDNIGFYEVREGSHDIDGGLMILEHSVSASEPRRVAGEDPRLFSVGNRTYVTFNSKDSAVSSTRFICSGEVQYDANRFLIKNLARFDASHITGGTARHQKNWVPFIFRDRVLWVYSLLPHRILALDHHHPPASRTNRTTADPYEYRDVRVTVVAETSVGGSNPWRSFGPMRGGTPPVKLNESTYIAIFHSSSRTLCEEAAGQGLMTYVMGAYLFSSEPPFNIIAISRRPIVGSGDGFYNGTWVHRRTNFIIFPGSIHVSNDVITVFYGRQDRESWVARLNRTVLLSNMVHVHSTTSFFNLSFFANT